MNSKRKYLIFQCGILLVIFFIISCENPNEGTISKLTIISYVLADNDLELFAFDDIDEMERAMERPHDGVNVIAYMDTRYKSPQHGVVFKIMPNTKRGIQSPIIYSYKENNSADARVFQTIVSNIIEEYPAQSYMLMVWSHGSGWVPPQYSSQNEKVDIKKKSQKQTKSFGEDNTLGISRVSETSKEMSIIDFSSALKSIGIKFSALFFDACFMGDVEVAYELKDASNYIIFSQAEIQSSGYPYDKIIPQIFKNVSLEEALKNVVKEYFNYYNNEGRGDIAKTATLSVIDTSKLSSLAMAVNECIKNDGITDLESVVSNNKVQVFSIENGPSKLHFDMEDIFNKAPQKNCYNNVAKKIREAVLISKHTKRLFDRIDLKDVSGLSMYIPETSGNGNNILKEYYKKLRWAKDSGIGEKWR